MTSKYELVIPLHITVEYTGIHRISLVIFDNKVSSGYLSNKRDLHRVCVVTNAMMYVGYDLVLITSRSVQSSRCVDLQLSWFVHMSHAEAFYYIRSFTILGRYFCLPLKSFLLALVCIKFRFFFHLEMDFHLIYISTQLRKHHRKKCLRCLSAVSLQRTL